MELIPKGNKVIISVLRRIALIVDETPTSISCIFLPSSASLVKKSSTIHDDDDPNPNLFPHSGGCTKVFDIAGMPACSPIQQLELASLKGRHAQVCVSRQPQNQYVLPVSQRLLPLPSSDDIDSLSRPTTDSFVATEYQQHSEAMTLGYGANNTFSFDPYLRARNSYTANSLAVSAMRSTASDIVTQVHNQHQYRELAPIPARGRKRLAISDLVLDMDVDVVLSSGPTSDSTTPSSMFSSAASSPSFDNRDSFGAAGTDASQDIFGRSPAKPYALGDGEHHTPAQSQSYTHTEAPTPTTIRFAVDLGFDGVSMTTHSPYRAPALPQSHATQGQPKATAQPRRAPVSKPKKTAASPASRKRSQAAATTASKTRRKKNRVTGKTKGARTESERIADMQANRWIMQFGVIHAVCAGCGSRFKNDKRSRFYPGLIEKHSRTCPGVKRKKAEKKVIEERERVWIYIKDEETYVLAKEDGTAADIVPGNETKTKTKDEDANVAVELPLAEEDELESEDDDDEYVPARGVCSRRF
ncbi:hypothetical protein C8F01DRAFT_1244042 [Mycena amicta]|nr:hypothetical protein C8F01DRAFT_1244042 [Mycena amicta]